MAFQFDNYMIYVIKHKRFITRRLLFDMSRNKYICQLTEYCITLLSHTHLHKTNILLI